MGRLLLIRTSLMCPQLHAGSDMMHRDMSLQWEEVHWIILQGYAERAELTANLGT